MCKSRFLLISLIIFLITFSSVSFSFALGNEADTKTKDRQITISEEVRDSIEEYLKSVEENQKTDGWKDVLGKTYYYVDNEPLLGKQIIDGKEYYFNASGEMCKGFHMLGARFCYFDKDTGELLSFREALREIFRWK